MHVSCARHKGAPIFTLEGTRVLCSPQRRTILYSQRCTSRGHVLFSGRANDHVGGRQTYERPDTRSTRESLGFPAVPRLERE